MLRIRILEHRMRPGRRIRKEKVADSKNIRGRVDLD